MIGTAMAFHYINRMATSSCLSRRIHCPRRLIGPRGGSGSSPPAVLQRSSRPVTRPARRWPSWNPPICRPTSPGARGNPSVAGAFARYAAAVDAAVQGSLHESVRERVLERLEAWDGADLGPGGLGPEELDTALAGVPPEERAAAASPFSPPSPPTGGRRRRRRLSRPASHGRPTARRDRLGELRLRPAGGTMALEALPRQPSLTPLLLS